MNNNIIQTAIIHARDIRQKTIDNFLTYITLDKSGSLLFICSNIPGSDKHRPGICDLLYNAIDQLRVKIGLTILLVSYDIIGQFIIAYSVASPLKTKLVAISIEDQDPCGRLLDIDVYRYADGCQLSRCNIKIKARSCFICDNPARECILIGRHSEQDLQNNISDLLQYKMISPKMLIPELFAEKLYLGALSELNLTPKPGLVDCYDSGSHKDLSYIKMRKSIDLLPLFFNDIIDCHIKKKDLSSFVRAGILAENRMIKEINSNAHKGFIFLSGIMLMAAFKCYGYIEHLSVEFSNISNSFFNNFSSDSSHSVKIQKHYKLGGIINEARKGLPTIFNYGWPKYREVINAGWDPELAKFYLMSLLMQKVEDTTALRRCGLYGLERLRNDGRYIQVLLEQQFSDIKSVLYDINNDYCKIGLTMGGVADCMALIFALQDAAY